MSYYLHHSPGRLRVRTPIIRRHDRKARAAVKYLRRVDGVERVHCRPLTGSIVVLYDEERIGPDRIIDALVAGGYLPPWERERLLAGPAFPLLEEYVARATEWALGQLLERSAKALLLRVF